MTDFAPMPDPSNGSSASQPVHQRGGVPLNLADLQLVAQPHPQPPPILTHYLFHPDPIERATVLRQLLDAPECVGEHVPSLREALAREEDPEVQALFFSVVERSARIFSEAQGLIPLFWRGDVSTDVVLRALRLSERYKLLVSVFAPDLLRMVGDDRSEIVAAAEGLCARCPPLAASEMHEIFRESLVGEDSPRVSAAAVQLLSKGVGRTGELIETLFEFAEGGTVLQRQVAYRTLGAVARRQTYAGDLLERIVTGLRDPDSSVVIDVLRIFESVRFRGHGQRAEIINCMEHLEESIRLASLPTIRAVGCFVDAAPSLVHHYRMDISRDVREMCRGFLAVQADGLVSNYPELFVDVLRISDSDPEFQEIVKEALRKHPPELDLCRGYIHDSSPAVRRIMAELFADRRSLCELSGAESLLPVFLLDPDAEVRMWGARLSARLGRQSAPHAAVLAYCASSEAESSQTRVLLLRTLRVVGVEGVNTLPVLTRMVLALSPEDREFSREVVRALTRVDLHGAGCRRLISEIESSMTGDVVQLSEILKKMDAIALLYTESWRSFRTVQDLFLSHREALEAAVRRVTDALPESHAPTFPGIRRSLGLAPRSRGAISFFAYRLFV